MSFRPIWGALARWVHDRLMAASSTGLRRRGLLALRSWLVATGDPTVRVQFAGSRMLMPLSHDLPHLRAAFPLYSENLARLTGAVVKKYPDVAVIDIGANVGDSVVLIRSAAAAAPVLCVEGDRRYLEFLRLNTASMRHVSIAPVFVAGTTGELSASIEAARGTGRLNVGQAIGGDQPSVATVSLGSLLDRYPLAGRVKLLKSDTDGFEAVILLGAIESLKEHRPVIFFECDPDMLRSNGMEALELLGALKDAGYARALLYDNFGDLMLGVELDDRRHVEEMLGYFDGRRSERYLDVAAFHLDDVDIFEAFRASELEFFRNARRESRS